MKKKELEAEVKKLRAGIKELNEILRWRHCEDKWHSHYHDHIDKANVVLNKLLKEY